MTNPTMMEALALEELEQIDGGSEYYSPCGCIQLPFPPTECTPPDPWM